MLVVGPPVGAFSARHGAEARQLAAGSQRSAAYPMHALMFPVGDPTLVTKPLKTSPGDPTVAVQRPRGRRTDSLDSVLSMDSTMFDGGRCTDPSRGSASPTSSEECHQAAAACARQLGFGGPSRLSPHHDICMDAQPQQTHALAVELQALSLSPCAGVTPPAAASVATSPSDLLFGTRRAVSRGSLSPPGASAVDWGASVMPSRGCYGDSPTPGAYENNDGTGAHQPQAHTPVS